MKTLEGDSTLCRNVGIRLHIDTASCSRRTELSATQLRKSKYTRVQRLFYLPSCLARRLVPRPSNALANGARNWQVVALLWLMTNVRTHWISSPPYVFMTLRVRTVTSAVLFLLKCWTKTCCLQSIGRRPQLQAAWFDSVCEFIISLK